MSTLFDLIIRLTPVFEKVTSLMFYIKDTEGKYLYISASLLKLSGKSMSDFLYKKSPQVWGTNKGRVRPLMTDEESMINGELTLIDKTVRMLDYKDDDTYVRVFKTPLYDAEEKNVIGILGVGIDITSDKGVLLSLFHIFFRRLSKSEKRYFFFRTEGHSRAEIARDMDTTIETIDSYRQRIMKKFKVNETEMLFLEKIYRIFINESKAAK